MRVYIDCINNPNRSVVRGIATSLLPGLIDLLGYLRSKYGLLSLNAVAKIPSLLKEIVERVHHKVSITDKRAFVVPNSPVTKNMSIIVSLHSLHTIRAARISVGEWTKNERIHLVISGGRTSENTHSVRILLGTGSITPLAGLLLHGESIVQGWDNRKHIDDFRTIFLSLKSMTASPHLTSNSISCKGMTWSYLRP